jgi:tRNA(adenine34) deaminase
MDHAYFMTEALKLAQDALDRGEFPVGCVMAYQGKIIASGARKHTHGDAKNEIDHAEMVALRHLSELTDEIDTGKVILYCTMEPCLMCLAAIIINGIRQIVYAYEDVMGGGTTCDLSQLKPLYSSSYIKIVPGIERKHSVELFKAFFADPDNDYWHDSLLVQYTLEQ